MARIAHIFKKGANVALCRETRTDRYCHRLYHVDVPRRNTVPTSEDSMLCIECATTALWTMKHGAHQVRMARIQARVHEAVMASQENP